MRVLVVAPSLDILGGMATQAAAVLGHLRAEPSIDPSFTPINPRLPRPWRRLQRIKYLRTIVTSVAYVRLLLRAVPECDVVHIFSSSHSSFLIASTPAILIARCWRKGIVLHYHSGDADDHLRTWRRTAKPTLRLVDVIVVPSLYLTEQFARHGLGVVRIDIVLELEDYSFRERAPLRPVFLSNRQLEPYCNVENVLRAFALIQRDEPAARLIVASGGSQRRRLEALAGRLALRAEFIGWVPPEDMPRIYDSADVYLNGSGPRDNIPRSILEAFAAGLPVVSTAVASVPELVSPGLTGLLVEDNDSEAMAAGAIRLLRDPLLAALLARRAREHCARFTWPVVREQWLELYGDLARNPRSRFRTPAGANP